MPIGGEAWGNAIGGFFGKDKIRTIYDSEPLNQYYETGVLPQLEALPRSATQAAAEYGAAVRRATPELEQIARDNQVNLRGLQQQYQNSDPYGGYERVRDGNFGSVRQMFDAFQNYGSRADKQNLALRGYGGRGPTAYENEQRAQRFSTNSVPLLQTILNNLGRDTSILENARLNNLNANFGIMDRQMALPLQTAGLSMLPYQAQAAAIAPQIALGRDLGSGVRENIAGRQVIPNKWRNFFQQSGRAGDQMADFALDAAMTYYGGGLAGGMGGGMRGNSVPASAPPTQPGYSGPNWNDPTPSTPMAGYFPQPHPSAYYQPPRPNYVYQW